MRLTDPKPKSAATPALGLNWPVRCRYTLPVPTIASSANFIEIVEGRRSERLLQQTKLKSVVEAVTFAVQPRKILRDDPARRYKSTILSAGALHSVSTILVSWRGRTPRAFRFSPYDFALEELFLRNPPRLNALNAKLHELVPGASDMAIIFVGDRKRIGAHYDYPETLLWRDAGAILQALSVTLWAFGIASCPVGILCSELIDSLDLPHEYAIPMGGVCVGVTAPSTQL